MKICLRSHFSENSGMAMNHHQKYMHTCARDFLWEVINSNPQFKFLNCQMNYFATRIMLRRSIVSCTTPADANNNVIRTSKRHRNIASTQ